MLLKKDHFGRFYPEKYDFEKKIKTYLNRNYKLPYLWDLWNKMDNKCTVMTRTHFYTKMVPKKDHFGRFLPEKYDLKINQNVLV